MRPLVTAEARAAQDQRSHKVTGSPALFLGVFLSPCVPAADRDSSCGQLLSSSEEVRIEADGMVMMIQLPDTEPDRKKARLSCAKERRGPQHGFNQARPRVRVDGKNDSLSSARRRMA